MFFLVKDAPDEAATQAVHWTPADTWVIRVIIMDKDEIVFRIQLKTS